MPEIKYNGADIIEFRSYSENKYNQTIEKSEEIRDRYRSKKSFDLDQPYRGNTPVIGLSDTISNGTVITKGTIETLPKKTGIFGNSIPLEVDKITAEEFWQHYEGNYPEDTNIIFSKTDRDFLSIEPEKVHPYRSPTDLVTVSNKSSVRESREEALETVDSVVNDLRSLADAVLEEDGEQP